jgi:hypothetical protein
MTKWSKEVKAIKREWKNFHKAAVRQARPYTPYRSPFTIQRAEKLKDYEVVPSKYRRKPRKLR